MALLYMADALPEICPEKVPDMIKRFTSEIANPRKTVKSRAAALYLCGKNQTAYSGLRRTLVKLHLPVDLIVNMDTDTILKFLDSVQIFLDSLADEDLRQSTYGMLGRLLTKIGYVDSDAIVLSLKPCDCFLSFGRTKHAVFRNMLTTARKVSLLTQRAGNVRGLMGSLSTSKSKAKMQILELDRFIFSESFVSN
jgi:hypothetical protein